MEKYEKPYWSWTIQEALDYVKSDLNGLSSEEASTRIQIYGENTISGKKKLTQVRAFLNQLKNPIILILLFATVISAITRDWFDAQIILVIVIASAILSFYQEYSAGQAIERLKSTVQIESSVKRDGKLAALPSKILVPGDIVELSTGELVPADGLLLDSLDLYVNQSTLTGESMAVEKWVGSLPIESEIEDRENCLFMGSNVFSGTATLLVMETGPNTQYGEIAKELTLRPPETDFERGVRQFGNLLTQIMLVLTLTIFAINVLLNKPALDSLLFSVALAVGITPQLLPAIISITLSTGARIMAKEGVIVQRLNSIENFGSMDTLCTDKTGTLTEGDIQLDGAMDVQGKESENVYRQAYLNATLQKGMRNTLDEAIAKHREIMTDKIEKIGEIAFDFNRRRLSVLYRENNQTILVTKGAFNSVLEICTEIELDGVRKRKDEYAKEIEKRYKIWSEQGIRVLGIAIKRDLLTDKVTIKDEKNMTFIGFLLFSDHPKEDVAPTIQDLAVKGIALKIITGDNQLIATHTAESVGIEVEGILTGKELHLMSDEALWQKVESTNLFAEVDPNQKERIILALKKRAHVVGYMGDGINDVPALHAADVSISVDNAVDVAKESADIVLMEKSLSVLSRGIEEGRKTFNNTLKYILVTTSANFGNMFSMAGISLFLPFFPLLPKQILLLNFLTDFPALTLSRDSVDAEMVLEPRRWDIKSIRNFMFTFGFLSSIFDYLILYILFDIFRESQLLFQSGWFTFSILTELFTLMVMRTRKPFYQSKPAVTLLYSTIFVGVLTLIIPYTPLATLFGIEPVPWMVIGILIALIFFYVVAMEVLKKKFYRSRL